ncbi:hypothetical protein AB0K60_25625 [Thermopolyspora sp. NPDC052614]|uniref:hypothetical protein n=1 Tax=Thermopolyspora sp. NPDC052614 TaxID=3155682 RepID=UPI00343FE70C
MAHASEPSGADPRADGTDIPVDYLITDCRGQAIDLRLYLGPPRPPADDAPRGEAGGWAR